MKRFFDLTFTPFFVITGIGTALASLYAFWPRWATETAAKIPFIPDYTIITQHWGIMVGLMGVFMMSPRSKSNGGSRFSSIAYLKKPSWFIWLWQTEASPTHRVLRSVQRWMRLSFFTRSDILRDSARRRTAHLATPKEYARSSYRGTAAYSWRNIASP